MLKLLIIQIHLTAVVKVIELLSEVVKDFSVASHVCRQDQDYHVPSHLVIINIISIVPGLLPRGLWII